eukprot:5460628-Pyramimonas_sp.AAC.1
MRLFPTLPVETVAVIYAEFAQLTTHEPVAGNSHGSEGTGKPPRRVQCDMDLEFLHHVYSACILCIFQGNQIGSTPSVDYEPHRSKVYRLSTPRYSAVLLGRCGIGIAVPAIAIMPVVSRGRWLFVQPQPPRFMLQVARVILGELLMHARGLRAPLLPFLGKTKRIPVL